MSSQHSEILPNGNSTCVICFSHDRNLFVLENLTFLTMLCPEISFNPNDRVCWECECIVRKTIKFKEKAIRTQKMLINLNNGELQTNSLSSLKTSKLYDISYTPDEDDSVFEKITIIDKPQIQSEIKDNIEDDDNIKIIKKELDDIKVEFQNDFDDFEQIVYDSGSDSEDEIVLAKIKNLDVEKYLENSQKSGAGVKKERIKKNGEKIHRKSKERKHAHATEKSPEKKQMRVYNGEKEVIAIIEEIDGDKMIELREKDRIEDSFRRHKLKCDMCIQRFGISKKYEEHNVKHSQSSGDFICVICQQRFMSKDDMERHRDGHYRCYKCVGCMAEFSSHEGFRHHYDANHRKTTRRCDQCDIVFTTKSQQRNHKIKVHDKKPVCPICGREYSSPTNMKRHMLQHTGIPMLECQVCHKKLKGQEGLRLHMRSHEQKIDEAAYCAECNIQFKSQQIYKIHLKSTLKHKTPDEFKYKCADCGKSFAHSVSLRRHIEAVHRREMRYACSTCGKKFNIKMQMRHHERKHHEGIEPPKDKVCDYCGKGFQTKVQLTIHIRTHTGERPFQCELCSMAFSQRSTLKTHMRGVHKHLKM